MQVYLINKNEMSCEGKLLQSKLNFSHSLLSFSGLVGGRKRRAVQDNQGSSDLGEGECCKLHANMV